MPDRKARRSLFSRRMFAKLMVSLSAVLIFAQFLPIGGYFSSPKKRIKFERVKVAYKAEVPVGKAIVFSYPIKERPAVLIHLEEDLFVAYDGVCTHLGCPVEWDVKDEKIGCPCHGAVFDPADGSVLQGPPPRPLPKIKLEMDGQNIYADGYESGLPLYGLESGS